VSRYYILLALTDCAALNRRVFGGRSMAAAAELALSPASVFS
jgi:hypothetical protein